ncbi:MAG: hypothetical protein A2X36_05705 [Elusimicrobia bacterium GWA2_69_24]|nr:MAG: hypothetical protein A2X36_05705 [Elusimicrobia bacterium GWA2_69_24]
MIGVLAGAVALGSAGVSWGQMQPGQATVTGVTGRAEALNPGQTQWVPLTANTRLPEGAQVRTFAGGSAEVALPDGSTILVAENSRYALTKLEVDRRTGARNIFTHLVVGKVRAQVRQAPAQIVQARQSNFSISTPTGVAAVWGTVVVFAFDPRTNTGVLFVLPSPGQPAAFASAAYLDLRSRTARVVAAGAFVSHVAGQLPSAPTPISALPPSVQAQVTAATNQTTANAPALTQATVVIVPTTVIQQALVTLAAATVAAATAPPPPSPAPALQPPAQPLPPPPAPTQPVSGQ